jgi:hypothetical protein
MNARKELIKKLIKSYKPNLKFHFENKYLEEFFIVFPSEGAKLCIRPELNWIDIKKRIDKIFNQIDLTCKICLNDMKVVVNCSKCFNDYCDTCFYKLFNHGNGTVKCPFCREKLGP